MSRSRALGTYAVLLTLLNVALLTTAMTRGPAAASFTEIDVERINVREPDGTLKLVISNSARQQEGTIGGEPIPIQRTRPAGMIFFNDVGDEVGGLVFGGARGSGSAGMMFDQFGSDQVIGVQTTESTDAAGRRVRQSGLSLWDRPMDQTVLDMLARMREVEAIADPAERARVLEELQATGAFGTSRLFLGRNAAGDARVNLRDGQGRVRLRLTVTEAGDALIEFLNEEEVVVRTLRAD